MAATYKDNGGSVNGSNKVFTYDFPTLQTEDVKVALNGATQATTKYTVSLSPANITFNNTSVDSSVQESDGSPKSGVTVRVYRETTVGKASGDEDPKAVFAAGSSIRAGDLNANVEQALFGIHELQEQQVQTESIADGAVTSGKIEDGTIVNADVNSSAAIAGTKVNPAFGSQNISTSGSASTGALGVTGNITVSGTVDGRDVATDGSKLDGIEAGSTGDQTNAEIRAAVEAATDSNVFTDADHSKLNAIEASATADQTAAEIRTLVESASDSNVFTDADHTKVNAAATVTGSETLTNKTLTSPVINDMSGTAVVTSGTSTSDNKTYSAKRAGEIFYGKDTVGEIQSGETWSAADDKVATTSAIDARIIDLVDDVGGFVPIANETSFPNANPDVNNGAGTLVSIKALSSNLTSNGSGVATIANGTVGNSTVTITGLANSTTYAATYGMIVETTTTLNTYTFHRQVPKATEVTTVAGSISNVNTVAGAISNVNAVAGNATNINAVAGNASNINSAVSNASNINSAVSNASNINSAVSNASNINTTAGSISNVNTVAGSISNVNSVASNMGTVNDFAARYRTGSSNPTSSLDTGDLFFNTSANELKVYNGSAWQGGVTATGSFAVVTGNTFTGENTYNDGVKAKFGTGSDLQIYHSSSDNNSYIQHTQNGTSLIVKSDYFIVAENQSTDIVMRAAAGTAELYYDNSKKLETDSTGIWVNGALRGDSVDLADSKKVLLGSGDDLEIYHDGSKSYLVNGTGNLELQNSSRSIDIKSDSFTVKNGADNEWMITATANGAVEIYYDNSKKFETYASGCYVYGKVALQGSEDGNAIIEMFADEGDDAADKYQLASITNGNWEVQNYSSGSAWETNIRATGGGFVSLYYDDAKKFETDPNGVLQGDNSWHYWGDSDDLYIGHNGTHSFIVNTTGQLQIKGDHIELLGNTAAEYLIRAIKDGAVELYYNNHKSFNTSSTGISIYGTEGAEGCIHMYADEGDDNEDYWRLTAGTDTTWYLQNYAAGSYETNIKANGNGNVELYFDNSKKLETNAQGILVGGDVDNSTSTQGVAIQTGGKIRSRVANTSADALIVSVENDGGSKIILNGAGNGYFAGGVDLPDSANIQLGTGDDLQIYHDGTNSFVKNTTGQLCLNSDEFGVANAAFTENIIRGSADGDVKLFYDGVQKLNTESAGVTITGNLYMPDNEVIKLGTGHDLILYHDASHSWIKNSTGNLYINAKGAEVSIACVPDGAVELRYNDVKTFETAANGIKVVAPENNHARIHMWADDGDDSADKWEIMATTQGQLRFYHGDSSENTIVLNGDGAVDLYHNNLRKFSTDADGIAVHAEEGADAVIYITADEGDDNADKWLMKATNGGGFHIQNYSGGSWENNLVASTADAVSLYYDNSKKLATYAHGVKVYTAWDGNPALDVRIANADSGSAATVVEFITDHYGGSRGNIGVTLSGTSYNTSSDYRLKENVTSLTGAITRVKNLSPKRFNFKEDTKTIDGFLAHEVSSVVPEAVTGDKDGSKMQQLDYSKLTTLTIAALQEALAKIETLETKVAALESS
jgi:hypothetical protein